MATLFVGSGVGPWIRFGRVAPFAVQSEVPGNWPEGPFAIAQVACQKGAPPRHGLDCLLCRRYRGWNEPHGQLRVHCEWTDEDPVSARMTLGNALVTVAPDDGVAAADELARRHEIRHLPVVEEGRLLGIVCRCDLVPPSPLGRVGDRMTRDVFVVPPAARLGEALGAMASLRIGCLPVVADGMLLGILTRGDLRRVGVPEELLGASYCAACHSPHGVRAALDGTGVEYCLDCLETNSSGDLGEGD
jgi:predicted transcriptional regulator